MSAFYCTEGTSGFPLPAAPPVPLLPRPRPRGHSASAFLRDLEQAGRTMGGDRNSNDNRSRPPRCRSPVAQPLRHRHLPASFWQEPNSAARSDSGFPGDHHPYLFYPDQRGIHLVPSVQTDGMTMPSMKERERLQDPDCQRTKPNIVRPQGPPVHKDFLERLQTAQTRGYDQVLAASRNFPIAHFLFYNYGLKSLYGMDGASSASAKNTSTSALRQQPDFSQIVDPSVLKRISQLQAAQDSELKHLDPAVLEHLRNLDPAVLGHLKHLNPAVFAHLRHLDSLAKASYSSSSFSSAAALQQYAEHAAAVKKMGNQVSGMCLNPSVPKQLGASVLQHLDPPIHQHLKCLQTSSGDLPYLDHLLSLQLKKMNGISPKDGGSPLSAWRKCQQSPTQSVSYTSPLSLSVPPPCNTSPVHLSPACRQETAGVSTSLSSAAFRPTKQSEKNRELSLREDRSSSFRKTDNESPTEKGIKQPFVSTTSCNPQRSNKGYSPPKCRTNLELSTALDLSRQQILFARNISGSKDQCVKSQDQFQNQNQVQGHFPAAALNFTFPTLCPYLGYNCPNHQTRGPHRLWDCVVRQASSTSSSSSSALLSMNVELFDQNKNGASWKSGDVPSGHFPPFVNA